MRKKTICILLIFILCLTVFSACGAKEFAQNCKTGFDSVLLYDDVKDYVRPEIKEKNKTANISPDDDGLPKEYLWTLTDQSEFRAFLLEDTIDFDFEDKYYVLYSFTCVYAASRYMLSNVTKADDELIIEYELVRSLEKIGNATIPIQRWFLFEINKPIKEKNKIVKKKY